MDFELNDLVLLFDSLANTAGYRNLTASDVHERILYEGKEDSLVIFKNGEVGQSSEYLARPGFVDSRDTKYKDMEFSAARGRTIYCDGREYYIILQRIGSSWKDYSGCYFYIDNSLVRILSDGQPAKIIGNEYEIINPLDIVRINQQYGKRYRIPLTREKEYSDVLIPITSISEDAKEEELKKFKESKEIGSKLITSTSQIILYPKVLKGYRLRGRSLSLFLGLRTNPSNHWIFNSRSLFSSKHRGYTDKQLRSINDIETNPKIRGLVYYVNLYDYINVFADFNTQSQKDKISLIKSCRAYLNSIGGYVDNSGRVLPSICNYISNEAVDNLITVCKLAYKELYLSYLIMEGNKPPEGFNKIGDVRLTIPLVLKNIIDIRSNIINNKVPIKYSEESGYETIAVNRVNEIGKMYSSNDPIYKTLTRELLGDGLEIVFAELISFCPDVTELINFKRIYMIVKNFLEGNTKPEERFFARRFTDNLVRFYAIVAHNILY